MSRFIVTPEFTLRVITQKLQVRSISVSLDMVTVSLISFPTIDLVVIETCVDEVTVSLGLFPTIELVDVELVGIETCVDEPLPEYKYGIAYAKAPSVAIAMTPTITAIIAIVDMPSFEARMVRNDVLTKYIRTRWRGLQKERRRGEREIRRGRQSRE